MLARLSTAISTPAGRHAVRRSMPSCAGCHIQIIRSSSSLLLLSNLIIA